MGTWHRNLGTAIRAFATGIAEAKPDLNHVEIARIDLVAAAYSIEAGEVSQGVLRLFLACRDLYAAMGEAVRERELFEEIGQALREKPIVYLDTLIISAMVRRDLNDDQIAAIERMLDVFQADFIDLCTSHVAKLELDRIPEQYRQDHVRLFRLIRLAGEVADTDVIPEDRSRYEAVVRLKGALSEGDFKHLIQAITERANYFLTCDGGILAQRVLAAELGITVLSPCELEMELRRRHLIAPIE
jgi:hypothetical protein